MSGGSSANNSWTILTSEETVAETLRPLAEGTEHHEDSQTSAAGSGEINQPENGAVSAEGLPVEDYPVSEEKPAVLSEDSSTDEQTSVPSDVTETPIPSSVDVYGSEEVSQDEGLPEGPAQFSPDPDSSSDSYTHVTPSPDEPPPSSLSTETLGGAEFEPEETLHPLNGEGLHQEGEESEENPRTTDLGKQADSPVDSEEGEERAEKVGEEGETRRRRSLLAALERIGRREEEEEEVQEFQLPQREEDSGFSVNKCILGAIILLGLGTIFFSESDYVTRELKDTEVPGKQEWLNPEAPPPSGDADTSQILHKLAEGNQQISVLQAQLQAQNEELKVAKGQAAVGAKDRLQREEVEKENSRLKTEMASLPVLQKENERMKKELESLPALQKELETLRATVTELKLSSASVRPPASPPTGQPQDSRQDTLGSTERQARKPWDDQKEKKKNLKRDKYDMGENKDWKERENREKKQERKDGGKREQKMEKHEQGRFDKVKDKEGKPKRYGDETKQWKEKDWKKEKASRGDERKVWRDKEGKKEWVERSEKKDMKEEKYRKKAKNEKVNEGKQWRGTEESNNRRGGKDNGERHKGKEEWKGEKEWKKVKDGFKASGKERWEKKDWREKGEQKEWKKESEVRHKNEKVGKGKGERKQWEDGRNPGKERTGKDERKQWEQHERKSSNGKQDKEWKRKDEKWKKKEEEWKRGGQKEKKHNGNGKKDRSNSPDVNHGHKEEHLYGESKPPHSHSRPSLGQPEYWAQQRDRLQHSPKPPQQCNSLESCAQAEGLLPVPLPEFEAVLQSYLAKAAEAGVDDFKREELTKLAAEFFKDGLFVHDQMRFQDFVEDVGDVLEDMVEGDEDEDEEDSAIEEEMEAFEREVMKKFSVPGAGEKEERIKGEWRKESRQGRG